MESVMLLSHSKVFREKEYQNKKCPMNVRESYIKKVFFYCLITTL
uniref:Uncharacterized protein n=1 Tax=Anguilla anguilla TaxID=7936 RepID=A0A0E9PMT5_ANGAN